MSTEALPTGYFPESQPQLRVPSFVPEKWVNQETVYRNFIDATDHLVNAQTEQIDADPSRVRTRLGDLALQLKEGRIEGPLTVADRVLHIDGAEGQKASTDWHLTIVEFAARKVLTTTSQDRVTYPREDGADTDISHYVYDRPNRGFGVIVTDGKTIRSNYDREENGVVIPSQLFVEGVSGIRPDHPDVLGSNGSYRSAIEDLSFSIVEESEQGGIVRHAVTINRGSTAGTAVMGTEFGALSTAWILTPEESEAAERNQGLRPAHSTAEASANTHEITKQYVASQLDFVNS